MPLYLKNQPERARQGNGVLSYVPGAAIAGTTKHVPGFASVPVAHKTGPAQRDSGAPPINAELRERAAAAEAQPTSYAQAHPPPAVDYTLDPRRGGGYWAGPSAQQPAALVDPKPFLGESTYQAELAKAGAAVGSKSTGGGAGAAGIAPPCSRPQPPTVKPGYLTQYTAASLPLQQRLASSPASAPLPAPASQQQHAQAQGRAGQASLAGGCSVMSRFDGATTYGQMYQHAPSCGIGYGGHVPSDGELVLAGLSSRVKKEDALLYHLDQHSRGLVPGYTGHKPAHNVNLVPPPPATVTTQGTAAQEALRWAGSSAGAVGAGGAALRTSSSGRAGVMGFFSSGGGAFVSENGQAEAAMFHQNNRPYEGLMRIPHSSSTNRHGAKFTA